MIGGDALACPPAPVAEEADTRALRDVIFKASIDGTEQRYVESLPDDFDANKKRHLIIGLHGHGADRWQFSKDPRDECAAFRAIAAKYDMIAVTPDYRATTSWMGPKAEADLLQIITGMKARVEIDKVFLVGASMGGTSALTFAVLHPDLVDGVVAMNAHGNHLEYENFQEAIQESFGGGKKVIPLEYKKRSAEYWPERLTMPVAITVGGKDTSVPPHSARRLASILEKLNPYVLMIDRSDQGHSTDETDATTAMEFVVTTALNR
ncbi:MAG: alpha/beta fold hydrolase [Opitutaceae bacterium]